MHTHVVVVGGGITGLAAAYEAVIGNLDSDSLKVTLLEQSDRFGGKIRTHQTEDFVIEAGPDSIYTRKSGGLELIRDLGIEPDMVYSPPNLKTGILRRGKLFPIPPGMSFGLPTNLRAFMFNSLIPLNGKLRGLVDFILPADRTSEDKSVGDLLRRRIGDDLVNILAEPMLAGIHAGNINRLSVNAVAPYLRDMEQSNRSLIRGMLKQGKAAKAASRQPQSQSGSTKPRGVFVSLTDGLEQLIETLVAALQNKVDMRKQTAVIQIHREATGVYDLTLRTQSGEVEHLTADAVVLTVPAFAARRLIPADSPVYDKLLEIPYVSTGAVSLVYPLQRDRTSLPFTGFLVPRGEDEMLTACTVVSSKWPNASRSGNVIVRGYIGRDGEEAALGKSDDVIIDHMKEQMRRYLGITVEPVWTVVDRWPQAMPQYLVGHNQRVEQIRTQLSADLPHFYLAGAGYSGMGIPDCISQGKKAMATCVAELTQESTSVSR